MTDRIQIQRDAAEEARAVFLSKYFANRAAIADPQAWGFRVGANAAKRLVGREGRVRTGDDLSRLAAFADGEDGEPLTVSPARRREVMARAMRLLTPHQFLIVSVMMLPGMTKRRAARLLDLDVRNLTRSLRRALARMDVGKGG